jgi:hypothetical protein
VLAPIPNWVCGRCANPDDFVESSGSGIVDFGKFCTGALVLMGIGMYSLLLFGSSSCIGVLRRRKKSFEGRVGDLRKIAAHEMEFEERRKSAVLNAENMALDNELLEVHY